ncbi:MAG: PAS domain S-box protein, partial [Alphaproteobacteria bacterium]|nr:PAS domain S-box protein [Alphaproteobacteria bacterium]
MVKSCHAGQEEKERSQKTVDPTYDRTYQKLPKEEFQRILEATPDAMVIINKEGIIIFTNTQAEKIFNYKKDELLGQPVEILIPEPYRSQHPKHREDYFSSPHVRPMGTGMELYGMRKNGEHFPVEISLSPFDMDQDKMALATVRDITDRKRFERTLQEKNIELENA